MKTYNQKGAQLVADAGNIRFYDTGWVACSDWTNQHLGSTLGGNVVHNLNTPLRNLSVKVFISTDGTDDNSFEMVDIYRRYDSASPGNVDLQTGITIYQSDNNNIIVQTGSDGIAQLIDANGTISRIFSDAYYYRVVVYQMSTVYSGVSMDYYETPWIACSDWTTQFFGTTLGNDLDHNLNAPLSELLVKFLISTDGTDGNSFEIGYVAAEGATRNIGYDISQVDSNSLSIRSYSDGLRDATGLLIDTEAWYYKIKVYKLTAQPPAIITSRVRVTKDDQQSVSNATDEVVEYDDVVYDSLGEWNSSTWRFTAKNAGYYSVKASLTFTSVAWAAGEYQFFKIYKNGTLYSYLEDHRMEGNVTVYKQVSGSDDIYLNGTTDYIDIRIKHNQGAALNTINANAPYMYVAIHRFS